MPWPISLWPPAKAGKTSKASYKKKRNGIELYFISDWLKLLVAEDISLDALQSKDDKVSIPPLVGALLKNEQDVTLFEKLVFMQSRNR